MDPEVAGSKPVTHPISHICNSLIIGLVSLNPLIVSESGGSILSSPFHLIRSFLVCYSTILDTVWWDRCLLRGFSERLIVVDEDGLGCSGSRVVADLTMSIEGVAEALGVTRPRLWSGCRREALSSPRNNGEKTELSLYPPNFYSNRGGW